MACIKCGKKLMLIPIKMSDGNIICSNCFKDLGFDPQLELYIAKDTYTWDSIKDGKDAYFENIRKIQKEWRRNNPGLSKAIMEDDFDKEDELKQNITVEHNVYVETPKLVSNYGQKREINATDGELEMFKMLCEMFPDEDFELCRKSDTYLTAMIGEWDIIRFKCSDLAKWIMLPVIEKPKKHYIDGPEYIEDYEAAIKDSIDFIK